MEQDLERLLEAIWRRAHGEITTSLVRADRDRRAQLAERGTLRSGSTYGTTVEAWRSGAKRLLDRLLTEVSEAVTASYGSIPAALVPELKGFVDERLTRLEPGLARAFEEARQISGLSTPRHHDEVGIVNTLRRDVDIHFAPLEIRARLFAPHPAPAGSTQYDVFISHASEDKASLAEPLAVELQRRGYRVWLDKFELKLGDRLMKRIDEGLAASRYGVVILSPAFFRKGWPMAELNALASLEHFLGQKKILPIWHDVTEQDVHRETPLLAAVLAARSEVGVVEIAKQIETVLRDP